MDFTFNEEQRLIGDMVERFVEREYSFEKRHKIVESDAGWSRQVWETLAELGLLALNIPQDGGEALDGPVNTMVVMNALGGALLLEPYLESAVVATSLLRELANEAQRERYFPALAEGHTIAVVAALEPEARYELAHVKTRAHATDGGFILSGRKSVVAHGYSADVLLVSARIRGEEEDIDGISVFAVPVNTEGVNLNTYRMVDSLPGADVDLNDVFVPDAAQLGTAGDAFDAIELAHHAGIAALVAEAAGMIRSLIDDTAEYLKTRQQFGQPLARFQALQHKMADMVVHAEQVRSMSYLATAHCLSPDAAERRKIMAAAKVLTGRALRFVRQQALQLHGGMGMTDELKVSHYFKRMLAMEARFGDADCHLGIFIEASRAIEA
jgi:alkylation response protein AidB-like acyl-CoA dehydrogenase